MPDRASSACSADAGVRRTLFTQPMDDPFMPVDNKAPRRAKRRFRTTGRVRIEEVARLAGVSPQTVSRFFRLPALVAGPTGERIRTAVFETGYVPNLIAGSLASNRSRVIAVIVPTIANPVHAAPVEGLSNVLRQEGYQVLLGSTGYDSEVEAELIAAFLGRRVDGLIITGSTATPETRAMIRAAGIPIVQIWELPDDPIDMAVGFSNSAAGADVARHLAERGYRRPLIVAHAAPSDTRSAARVTGFLAAAGKLKMDKPPVLVTDRTTTVVGGADTLDRILALDPDSVFAVSDQIGVGIVLACLGRNIPVPARFGVVGFGDVDIAAKLVPSLTTIHVHRHRLGEMAGELLLRRFRGETVNDRVLDIGYELVVRDSTPDRRPAARGR